MCPGNPQTIDSPYLELMKHKRIVDVYLLRIMASMEPQVQISSNYLVKNMK